MVFVTVKHGANEGTLFNQDCRSITLLNAIREKCSLTANEVIDLSDREGNVKDLRKHPNMVAKEVLGDREDVILLRVGENDKGKLVYTPLLVSDEIITKAFLERLAKGSKRESNTVKGPKAPPSSLSTHAGAASISAGAKRSPGGGDAATSSTSSVGKQRTASQQASGGAGQQKKR